MLLVYAGRRVDADADGPQTEERFPARNIPRVAREIETILIDSKPSTVIGSAACGADLLVLEAAGRLGIRRRIILPFDRARFRASSVTDRPGDWGPRFDAVIDEVSAAGDVVQLSLDSQDDATYQQANVEIYRDAETLAQRSGEECRALVVWNGVPRGKTDVTEGFLNEANRRRWPVMIVHTTR